MMLTRIPRGYLRMFWGYQRRECKHDIDWSNTWQHLKERWCQICNWYSFRKYGEQVLNESTIDISEDEIGLCLRIADIFSKVPNESDDSEHYHSLAQEIIYMLKCLLPNRKDVDLVSDSVLSSLSNYPVRKNMGLSEEEKTMVFFVSSVKNKDGQPWDPWRKGEVLSASSENSLRWVQNRSFSYSGPTSMGKTFLMTTFIKQRIDEGRDWNFAIIVPTKALINELKGEVIREFKNEILERNYRVISSANDLQLESEHKFILVMTPERLMYFLIKYRDIVLDYVFFDEAHKISEKDPRSSFYYKDISLLSKNSDKTHIIFSSPNIPNPDIYSKLYGGDDGKSYRSQFSPVSQFKFYINQESKSFRSGMTSPTQPFNFPARISLMIAHWSTMSIDWPRIISNPSYMWTVLIQPAN